MQTAGCKQLNIKALLISESIKSEFANFFNLRWGSRLKWVLKYMTITSYYCIFSSRRIRAPNSSHYLLVSKRGNDAALFCS